MAVRIEVLILFAVASCGGSTIASSSNDHDASVSGGGGAGQAGTTVLAGSGGSTSMGSGGSGSTMLDPLCLLPREPGNCEAAFPSFWNNPKTGVCEPFLYGGCGGNANRFMSREACQKACKGGDPEMDACSTPLECVITPAQCCTPCGPVTAQSRVAVKSSSSGAYSTAHGCDTVDCAACPEVPPQPGREFLTATCQAGQCTVVDVRETDLTKCGADTDCVLRNGLNCCESCGNAAWIAINAKANLTALACGEMAPACPPCVAPEPVGVVAMCVTGRCVATTLLLQ